jgi:hypothetical protein
MGPSTSYSIERWHLQTEAEEPYHALDTTQQTTQRSLDNGAAATSSSTANATYAGNQPAHRSAL